MTNTPIHRIPLEGMTEQGLINAEGASDPDTLGLVLERIPMHTMDPAHLTPLLDWAMQLRDRTGCNWATALNTASVAYFG